MEQKKAKIYFIPITLHLGADIGTGWSQMDLCLNPHFCHFLVVTLGHFHKLLKPQFLHLYKGW